MDVVFMVEGDHVKAVPVKIGICDDNYWEITDGLTNGQEIVSGGYRAISRDLKDGTKIHKGPAEPTPRPKRNECPDEWIVDDAPAPIQLSIQSITHLR